ncbi:hypothetical protein QYM36_011567 [Artemia franciscana]|uniref:Reverse transcriptase n=1 Tax=Artemia franciscana TaxID=6661 RepID=A0AA88KZ23_ARTSF|nr:hypothetical protein QYM36_011567 [Artemia franciscana]
MEKVFKGLDIGLVIDDITGTVKDKENHDAKLRMVLQQAREKEIRFNQEKCIFDAESIPYFGHLFTTEGIKADQRKQRQLPTYLHQNHMNCNRCKSACTAI